MTIRRLEDVLKEKPEYVPGWNYEPVKKTLENPKFGSVEQIVIFDENEEISWDQYQIKENVGAVIVPYSIEDDEIYVGFIKTNRPVVNNKEGIQGIVSLELPRGFGEIVESSEKSAKRELLEETGLESIDIDFLGEINANTAFYATNIPVYAVRVDFDKKNETKSDKYEKIFNSEKYNLIEIHEKINNGDIICGLTQAALMKFFSKYVIKQKA